MRRKNGCFLRTLAQTFQLGLQDLRPCIVDGKKFLGRRCPIVELADASDPASAMSLRYVRAEGFR